jgi:hypothetical protein
MEQGTHVKITKQIVNGEVELVIEKTIIDAVPPAAKSAEEKIAELEAKLEALLANNG